MNSKNPFSYTFSTKENQEVLNSRKKKYAPEILKLSEKILEK